MVLMTGLKFGNEQRNFYYNKKAVINYCFFRKFEITTNQITMQITLSFPQLLFKVCNKCSTEKPISEFNKHKGKTDGYNNACKLCYSKWNKPKTKEQAIRDTNKYKQINPQKVKDNWKRYYDKNKDKLKVKTSEHKKGKGKDVYKKWYEKYRPISNEKRRLRRKNMPPNQRIEKSLRDRFQKVIVTMKSGKKVCSWRALIGCTVLEAKEHIEKQFTDGMSWDNHGNGEGKWNIDHIKPLHTFNLFDIEQQKEAFHYTNTRPLWFIDNMSRNKGIKKKR